MLRNALRAEEVSIVLHEVLDGAKRHYPAATPIAIEELPHYQPWKLDFRVSFREQPDIEVALHEGYIEELLREHNGKGNTRDRRECL